LYDALAISFVSAASDLEIAKDLIDRKNRLLPVVAKIETGLGVDNIHEIVDLADAVMLARGDLALAAPWIDLPKNVDTIVAAASRHGRPWILATQIVEGLERFSFPTRAEISDLARWAQAGAAGVMLSFETAWGARPVEAVRATAELVSRYYEPPKSDT
jgi:pyruvate kinase